MLQRVWIDVHPSSILYHLPTIRLFLRTSTNPLYRSRFLFRVYQHPTLPSIAPSRRYLSSMVARKVKAETEIAPPVVKKVRSSRSATKSAPAISKADLEDDAQADIADEKPVNGKAKAKSSATKPIEAVDNAPPAKTARGKAKAKETEGAEAARPPRPRGRAAQWPPVELDPSKHPARAGYPVHSLPPLNVAPNGAIPSTTPGPLPHFLGAHVSIAAGPATALYRAGKMGANGLALFVKSQRQWKSTPYEQEAIDRFKDAMKPVEQGGMGYGPETILVHGSYLINLGNPDPAKWNMSYTCFKDDIERCHQLGVKLYNWQ